MKNPTLRRSLLLCSGSFILVLLAACPSPAPAPSTPASSPSDATFSKPPAATAPATPRWFTALSDGTIPALDDILLPQASLTWKDHALGSAKDKATLVARLREIATRFKSTQLRASRTANQALVEGTFRDSTDASRVLRIAMVLRYRDQKIAHITVYGSPKTTPSPAGQPGRSHVWRESAPNAALEQQVRANWTHGLSTLAREDLVFVDAAHGTISHGTDALKQARALHQRRFDKATCPIQSMGSSGAHVWVHSICSGIYRGAIAKRGVRVQVEVLDSLVFQDGRLVKLTSYTHPAVVAKQLGLKGAHP